jgi:predicted solute-binding protein
MRLLIDDAFATKTYTIPVTSNWVPAQLGLDALLVERLTADEINSEDAALIPSSALGTLHATHDVVPDVAIIADAVGTIAMRTPARPDEIEATPVRLLDAGGTAELLARATLQPFYGITPTAWIREDEAPETARAEVVIVAGAEALREPEGGFSEDLARAWFILTAQPAVGHVLVVPRDSPMEDARDIVRFLDAARAMGIERRRDWRPQLADREGVGRDRASAFWAAQRLTLEAEDRRALLDLLAQGSRGMSGFSPSNVRFVEGIGAV